MRPFYFGSVLWGEKFCRYLLDYCIPSLLSPGNIPVLENGPGHRFLLCMPAEDWARIQIHPTLPVLARYVTPEWIPFPAPAAGEPKMRAMSRGHKSLAERMFADRARGVFIYPDTIFADGGIAEIRARANQGKTVVLAHCPRLANEGFLKAVAAAERVVPGVPIAIAPRPLMSLALSHMHSETRRGEWDAVWFYPDAPAAVWWRVTEGGLVFHSLAWAPVLVDYASLETHDVTALDHRTIDADYVYRNVPDIDRIHVADDSDAIALVSFTSEEDLTFLPLRSPRLCWAPPLHALWRMLALRSFLNSDAVDPLKRLLFARATRVHSDEPGESFVAAERMTTAVASRALEPLSHSEARVLTLLKIANEGFSVHLRYWLTRRFRLLNRAVAP